MRAGASQTQLTPDHHPLEVLVRFLSCLFVLLVLAVPGSLPAAGQDELLAIDANWNTLRLKSDVAGLDKLLADDWVLTHSDDWVLTHSDGKVQTKADSSTSWPRAAAATRRSATRTCDCVATATPPW